MSQLADDDGMTVTHLNRKKRLMTMSPFPQQPVFGDGDLAARMEALEARVQALEARREVRTHAKVAEREHRIIEALENQTVPVTTPVLAGLVGADIKATDSTCRKLVTEGRILRAEVGSRTPHYAAVR